MPAGVHGSGCTALRRRGRRRRWSYMSAGIHGSAETSPRTRGRRRRGRTHGTPPLAVLLPGGPRVRRRRRHERRAVGRAAAATAAAPQAAAAGAGEAGGAGGDGGLLPQLGQRRVVAQGLPAALRLQRQRRRRSLPPEGPLVVLALVLRLHRGRLQVESGLANGGGRRLCLQSKPACCMDAEAGLLYIKLYIFSCR